MPTLQVEDLDVLRPRLQRLLSETQQRADDLFDLEFAGDDTVERLCDLTAALNRWVEDGRVNSAGASRLGRPKWHSTHDTYCRVEQGG